MASLSQEQSSNSLKRTYDDSFDDLADLEQPFHVPPEIAAQYATQPRECLETAHVDQGEDSFPTPPISVGNKMGPASNRSRSASLTDPGSNTPSVRGESPVPEAGSRASPMPSAFVALNGNGTLGPPPAKKAKLTFQERESKKIEKEIRDRERAAERARKDQERQAQAEDRARRDAEKDVEKKKKDAEKEQKRLVQEADKAAKEEKKRKREEEKQRAEDAKRKEQSKQKSLSSFFTIPAVTAARRNSVDRRSESPVPNSSMSAIASPAAGTPKKMERTAYQQAFPDFYIYPNLTMAPINRFERDPGASELLESTVDSYLAGDRSPGHQRQFDAESLFHISSFSNVLRGKQFMPVREIMTEFSGKSTRPIDLTSDSQNTQIKRTTDHLRQIPLKFLKFPEDIRPPYRGTYTSQPVNGMAKLARNPLRRDLPGTNYDYDSEAEWVEDEDAEDLNSEGEEDEELGEDGEDMEGFLDDENDESANSKRLVLQGDLEPVSTGLCWEDERKRSTNVKMMPYRMEIIIDQNLKSIDPFSTEYWQPAPAAASMNPPRRPLDTFKSNSLTINGASKPVKPFFTPAFDVHKTNSNPTPPTQIQSSAPTANGKPKKLVPQEDMPAFKQEIEGSNLSKVGLIEVLKKKFPGKSGAMIKNTLEIVAMREGSKEADKRWVLLAEAA